MPKPSGVVLRVPAVASGPASPPAGSLLLYFKSDGRLYKKNSAGVETVIHDASDFSHMLHEHVDVEDGLPAEDDGLRADDTGMYVRTPMYSKAEVDGLIGGVGGGGASVQTSAPASPPTGALWYDTDEPTSLPTNVVTTDTAQAISGFKTFSNGGEFQQTWAGGRFAPSATGAVTTTRYVGGTISGAPTTGAHLAGDFVIAQNGKVWICTADGTPGTWADAGASSAPSNMVTTDTTQEITGQKIFGAPLAADDGITTTSIDVETIVFTDTVMGPTFRPTGFAGSTQASRYVGGTTSGAPASGNYETGDFVVARDGKIWICTAGGSPGTWVDLASFTVESYTFSVTGALTTQTGKSRIYLEGNYVVETIRAAVNTAPTGASLIVDVNKNGTTIYTTQSARPTIAASGFTATGNSPAITTFAAGDYMTVDVDQVGSTVAGSDLTVTVRLRRVS